MIPEHIESSWSIYRIGRWRHQRVLIVSLGTVASIGTTFVLLLAESLHNILVGATLVRLIVLSVLEQHLIHVGASILEQFAGAIEYDESDFAIT